MTIPNHYMWMYRDKTILYMVKLTLRLSCAMNFAIYPHDTQECKLQMESCKWFRVNPKNDAFALFVLRFYCSHPPPSIHKPSHSRSLFSLIFDLIVSHTTDDMIFQWDPSVPLVVDDNIELPQLALVKNHTADCK